MKKSAIVTTFFFCVIFLFLTLAHGGEAGLVIEGKVIDKESRAAIKGAFIEIENASGGSGYSRVYTDENGEFKFQGLPSGVSFNLYVERSGFTSHRRLYWYIDPNKEMESIIVKLSREAVFKCHITGSDRKTPINRARVKLTPMRWRRDQFSVYEFERETGDNGFVSIDRIPSGTYQLVIERNGYIREKIKNITFLAGRQKEMDIILYRPASISGRVLLTDGKTPLSGIPIISRGPSANTSTSNFKGAYLLNDLKPGTYGFTAVKPGFLPYTYRGEVTVKEGEDVSGIDHFLEAKEEKIRIAIYQEVYPLKKEIRFTVRVFRSEDFNLEFYRIPIKWYLKNHHDFKGLLRKGTALGRFKVVHSARSGFKRYRPYTWFTKQIKIENKFSPGIYLVRATTSNAEDRNFIFVSNIGVVVKRGKGSLLTYAVNFETNRPEKGMEIFVLKGRASIKREEAGKNLFQKIFGLFTNRNVLLKGETDSRGIFKADSGIPASDLMIMGLKPEQGVAISESYISTMIASRGAKYYFFTDRPVYRPGHKVFFKGILREDDGKDLRVVRNRNVFIEMKGPENKVITTLKRSTDEMGTLNGSFELPPDAALGRYTLSLKGYNIADPAYFHVQAYRKPDFKVELKTDKKAYVTDATIKCRIMAAYFSGTPLAGARVKYNVYQKMTRRPYYRSWWEGEYYRGQGFLSLIKSGTVKTDAQGFVRVEFMPPPKSYDRLITIEAEVMAISGRKVLGRKSVVYNQSLYQIEVKKGHFIHKLDKPLKFRVNFRDIEGNPVKAKFTAVLEQEVWNPVRSRYEKPMIPMYSGEFETDNQGRSLLEIPLSELKPGHVRLIVSALDPRGNRAVKSTHFWLYDSLFGDFNYNYAGLEILLDKGDYRPGDTARLLINSPLENGVILFTMEGPEIMEHQVIPMKSRTRVIEIPVKKGFSPNVWLSVLQNDGNRLYHKKVSLNVAVEGKEMNIEAVFDSKEYRPGATAGLRITATDHEGRPVKGDLSIGVVDEAIYYIRPDHTTPIFNYFYARRAPWISTSYSFPIRYLGGAVKDGGTRIIRKDFRDTAFWLPNLKTGVDGRASVKIPLPDNLTTWVATIRGHSDRNIFGEKREKCITTKPLITSLKLPRFFIRGDLLEVRAVNHNRTNLPLEHVKSSLEVEGPLLLEGPPDRTSQIPKQGSGRLAWRVKVGKGAGESILTVHTEAGNLHDAEQRKVPVISKGLSGYYDLNGRTSGNKAEIGFSLSKEHAIDMTSLDLALTPHPALAGLSSLDYLRGFPYGCVEQTLNSFVPMAAYYAALKDLGRDMDDEEKLRKRIETGISKIEGFQGRTGGFGWWKEREPDVYLTSLVFLGISKIKEVNSKRCRLILVRASKYLLKQLMKTPLLDVKAFGLYALSEGGFKSKVLIKALRANLTNMDALTLSFSALAFANHGMMGDARKAAGLLLKQIGHTAGGSFFPEPESLGNRLAIETTAFALTALLRTYPENPEIERILRWLVFQRTGKYWVSTKTTGVVVSALSEYLMKKKDKIEFEDQTVTLRLNQGDVSQFRLKRADFLKGKGYVVSLPARYLLPGENCVRLECEHDLYYAMRIRTFLEADRVKPESNKCDMHVVKRVFAITRVHDSRGNPRLLSRPLEGDERLDIGKEVKIEVRFTPDRDYDYFILEDGLPSGFEVVDFKKSAGVSWRQDYAHKERRDQKTVFFFDHLYKGRAVMVEYILRSELNGEFNLPPARLYGMYMPSINAHSGSGRLAVGPGGVK